MLSNMRFKAVQDTTFFIILVSTTIFFAWILKDYIMPIFWALVLAIVFAPINEEFIRKFKLNRTVGATLSLSVLILMIIIPSSLIGALFIKELKSLYDLGTGSYAENIDFENVNGLLQDKMHISIDLELMKTKAIESLKSYGSDISSFAFGVGRTSLDFIIKFLVMLYILFFFFKDGPFWVKRTLEILPLGRRKETYLLTKFAEMTRAVFKGSFVIALVQGALGGILFWIVGIPSPVVWAALMMLLAFIPAIGPALIWAPAAATLFLTGNTLEALVVLLGGVFLVGTIDNFLRPYLVGKNTNMPDLLIFLSVLGALSIFGAAGLVIGPVVSALFLAVWELFEKEFKDELKKYG